MAFAPQDGVRRDTRLLATTGSHFSDSCLCGCRDCNLKMCNVKESWKKPEFGEVTERPKVQHWKCCVGESSPRVRIPPSPLLCWPVRHAFLMHRPLPF